MANSSSSRNCVRAPREHEQNNQKDTHESIEGDKQQTIFWYDKVFGQGD